MESCTVTIDEALIGSVGEFGRAQRWLYSMASLAWVPSALQTMIMVFVTMDPVKARMWACVDADDTKCQMALNATVPDVCGLPREAWQWTHRRRSIVSEWDLVCDDAWKAQATNSGFFLGFLLGAALFGAFSDRFGRRPTLFLAVASTALAGAASAFAPGYWWYLALRTLTGACNSGIGLCAFVLATEYVGPAWRGLAGIATMYFFTAGCLLAPALAWAVPAWRPQTLLASVPGLLYLTLWGVVQESPRWLLVSNRKGDATAVLAAIAVGNRTRLPEAPLGDPNAGGPPRKGLADLAGTARLRMRLVVMMFGWLTCSMGYYGLQLLMGSLTGSIYLNTTLSFLIEVPAYVVCCLLIDRIGRRPLFMWTLLEGGLGCIACAASTGTLQRAFAMAGRFGVSAAFACAYIYTSELFPTTVRASALGATSVCARLGGIVAPFIVLVGTSSGYDFVSFLSFGTTMLLAGLLAALLPETLGAATSETLAQPLLRSPDDARLDLGVHSRRQGWARVKHSFRSLMRPEPQQD